MSEQKSFMQQLDVWTGQTIIDPLLRAAESGDTAERNRVRDAAYRAIRQKVLESYRNGQQAKTGSPAPRRQYKE